jgi:hypothetical protein
MGGSIRKEFDCNKITHLIANKVGGEKYQYAVTFNIPVMSASWVHLAWEKRHDLSVRAIDSTMVIIWFSLLVFITFLQYFSFCSKQTVYLKFLKAPTFAG